MNGLRGTRTTMCGKTGSEFAAESMKLAGQGELVSLGDTGPLTTITTRPATTTRLASDGTRTQAHTVVIMTTGGIERVSGVSTPAGTVPRRRTLEHTQSRSRRRQSQVATVLELSMTRVEAQKK